MNVIPTLLQAAGFAAALIGLYLLLPIALFLVVGGSLFFVLGVLTEVVANRTQTEPAPNRPVLLRKKGGE
jgi:hypothetical protein